MRLPRRVPWAHISELEQVCAWIYADEEDLEAKTLAINRLSAWKAMSSLPHALDSALAILVARMLDASSRDTFSIKTALSLRQNYAMAIIRMVNGLVDPLQSGAYARSIAAIATQLGLPLWLVELRHAATHENLPSLELLREAGRESLSWLLYNFFNPTLNPSAPMSTPPLSLRPVDPLLRSYKLLMKAVTRDASLRKQYQGDIDAAIRSIERWISETKVTAGLATHPLGWVTDDNFVASQVDIKEKWALEILCDALFKNGAVVPISKKKCRAPTVPFLPTAVSLAVWTPLLQQLYTTHPALPSIFINRIISVLLEDLTESNDDVDVIELDSKRQPRDALHSEYLARWVTWVTQTWTDDSEYATDLRKGIILQIAPAFMPGHDAKAKANILYQLLQAISVGSKDLEDFVELIDPTMVVMPSQPWQPHDLVNMEKRLRTLTTNEHHTAELSGIASTVWGGETCPGETLAVGWKLLDNRTNWSEMTGNGGSWYLRAVQLTAGLAVLHRQFILSVKWARRPRFHPTLPKECQKAAKIFASFVDSRNNRLDGIIPRSVLERARGFAIFTVFKAGFLFSARAGSGIVIAKLPNGSWSAPSAIGSAGVGVGGQIGAEMTDFLVVLNSPSAVKSFMSAGSLTLGGNLSIAVGPLGRNGEAIGSLNSSGKVAAMYSYSKTRGLFGGVSIEGSVIVERQDANALAYNQDVTVKMLLSGATPCPDWAEPLVNILEASSGQPPGIRWVDDRVEGDATYAFGGASGTGTSSSKSQKFPFLGKKKKNTDFPPPHWGTHINSGSYFSDDFNDYNPEGIDEPSRRISGFDDEFDSGFGSVQQTKHRSSRSVGASTNSPGAAEDPYDPESPFNSLPPFRLVQSRLSDKTTLHSRTMSTPNYSIDRDSLPGYTNPFSSTPPPEDDLEYDRNTVRSSPPRFKTKPELSKPLSPLEGVARAIALYDFKAVEAGDLSFSKGDVITITRKSDSIDDWWTGKLSGKEGIFPANFVEIV